MIEDEFLFFFPFRFPPLLSTQSQEGTCAPLLRGRTLRVWRGPISILMLLMIFKQRRGAILKCFYAFLFEVAKH